MDKFMHFVEDKMSPIADKLGEQRHLSAKRFYDSITINLCWGSIYGYC